MEPFDFLQMCVQEEHKLITAMLDKLTDTDLDLHLHEDTTIRQRLLHMTKAEYGMAGYLYAQDNDNFTTNDNADLTTLKAYFAESMQRHLLTLQQLEPEDIQKKWVSKVSGNTYSYSFLLYHFLEHLATHRGQIAYFLNTLKK